MLSLWRKRTSRNCEGILQRKGETSETPSSSDVKSNVGAKTKVRLSNASQVNKKTTPVVEARINGHEFVCVVDTGASISLISKGNGNLVFQINSLKLLR